MVDTPCKGKTWLFFPEQGHDGAVARAVCHGCSVRLDCLEYALAHAEEFGIWGGCGERERERIRAYRRRAVP